jgi:lipopolysaccharide assembly outer membrane protein LptD (OstA)
MHRLRASVLLCFVFGAAVWLGAAEEKPAWTIESEDEVEMDFNTGISVATNGVTIRYGEAVLTSRQATLHQHTGDVYAEGDVRLERAGQIWRGAKLHYNFVTQKIIGWDFHSGHPPYYVRGRVMVGDDRTGVYASAKGFVTTDDFSEPGYYVRSRSLVVVPGEYLLARRATLFLGRVPVFYYPVYRRSLKRHPNTFTHLPGYRAADGMFLLTTYNWYWNEQLDGALHLDGRLRRGIGLGPDVHLRLPRFGESNLKLYRIDDDEPGVDPTGKAISAERHRLWFSHTVALRTNLAAKAVVRYQSDSQILRDFFESEYRQNVQPGSYVEVHQQWPNWGLNLLVQPRVNAFFETVERLPDVRLTGYRQQLGASPLFYESESSAGWFRRKFADNATNDFAAWRADSYHQLTLPRTFFNWLNVTPRVGGRLTYYGESDGLARPTRAQDREVFNTGVEFSTKASRLWEGVQSRFWELDGLRHIVEPSVNYVYVPRPNRPPPELPPLDYEVPTTRLLPIEFPDYNAIDSIDTTHAVRLTLRNRLQTKRGLGIANVVHWALYSDWRIQPRPGQGTFSDLFSDLDLQPWRWLTLASETRYSLDDHLWKELNHSISFLPNDKWSVLVGHRYLRDDLAGVGFGNNLIYDQLYYRFNENWGVRASHYYDIRTGLLQEEQYSLYRDFRSWTAAFSLRFREDLGGRRDFSIGVTFSLKAFPRFKLGQDASYPSVLLGN